MPYLLMMSPCGEMHALNSNGPRTNHCGTPNGTDVGDELSLPIRTSGFLSAKYDRCQPGAEPDTEYVGDSTHQNAMVKKSECCF